MEIINVGCDYRHPSDFVIDRPYGSGDYILLIIKTEAFAVLRGERVIVPQNSAIMFKKGTPQHYGGNGGEYINDWIHFEMDDADACTVSELGIPFDTVIPLGHTTELSGFIKNIFWERYSHNIHREASMQRYFDLILLKLSEKIYAPAFVHEHPYYALFLKLRNGIQIAPQNDWSIDLVSEQMNLSRSYVQHLYKLFFDTSIVQDVQRCRMEQAKYLLTATNVTVTAIAQACGYSSDVHFMRIFKKVTDMTPTEFRNRYANAPDEVRESQNRSPFLLAELVSYGTSRIVQSLQTGERIPPKRRDPVKRNW